MKVTFTLRDLSASFYEELAAMASSRERFVSLCQLARGPLRDKVKQKIGTGQMRDAVELNALMGVAGTQFDYRLEPRKGYRLATFEIA